MDQLGGVPVGEAETAVGTGAGDILRLRRAVNAIPLKGETDPGRTHGVIGAWRKNKLIGDALLLGGEGEDLGVEGVVGHYAATTYKVQHYLIDSLMKCVRGEDDFNSQKECVS